MKIFFKKLIKRNPILFSIWFIVYRKRRGVEINFFSKETRFLLDGYPRSGNTFLTHIAKVIFGSNSFIHHFHAVAPIKIALSRNYPCFILIRDPENAITSYYLKTFALKKSKVPNKVNETFLQNLLDEYIDYYSYVKKVKSSINIIHFTDLIRNPNPIIENINFTVFSKEQNLEDEVKLAIKTYSGATDTYGSSKPNLQKETLKNELKIFLRKYHDFSQAQKIYLELTQ